MNEVKEIKNIDSSRSYRESGLAHLVVQLTILYKLRYAGTSTRCFFALRYFLLQLFCLVFVHSVNCSLLLSTIP